jgi:hypothetical protein
VLDVVIVSGIFDRQDDLGVGFAPVLMWCRDSIPNYVSVCFVRILFEVIMKVKQL